MPRGALTVDRNGLSEGVAGTRHRDARVARVAGWRSRSLPLAQVIGVRFRHSARIRVTVHRRRGHARDQITTPCGCSGYPRRGTVPRLGRASEVRASITHYCVARSGRVAVRSGSDKRTFSPTRRRCRSVRPRGQTKTRVSYPVEYRVPVLPQCDD